MTGYEKQTLERLIALKKESGNLLRISLCGGCDQRKEGTQTASAYTKGRKVVLYLYDPEDRWFEWDEAIKKAEQAVDLLRKTIEHEKNHPVFFTALEAHLTDFEP